MKIPAGTKKIDYEAVRGGKMRLLRRCFEQSEGKLKPEIEKFVTETVIKIAYAGIPFAVHAMLAKQLFTDGFEVDYLILLWIMIWTVTALRTPKYGSVNTESAREKIRTFTILLYSISYMSLILERYSSYRPLVATMPYSFWVKILLLVVGTVLLVLSYRLFNKRYVDYNKDE